MHSLQKHNDEKTRIALFLVLNSSLLCGLFGLIPGIAQGYGISWNEKLEGLLSIDGWISIV
jgi:hypothetical protein